MALSTAKRDEGTDGIFALRGIHSMTAVAINAAIEGHQGMRALNRCNVMIRNEVICS